MSDQPIVRQERTHWRDEQISTRHRLYGWDAPALDVDFLMVEYDSGKPSALVEYKAYGAKAVNVEHPSYRAIRVLADAARIPFLVAFYGAQDHWWYYVIPVNHIARRYVEVSRYFSERGYVELLYRVRGKPAPQDVLSKLNTFQPIPRKGG
jgi:hypothetical protein